MGVDHPEMPHPIQAAGKAKQHAKNNHRVPHLVHPGSIRLASSLASVNALVLLVAGAGAGVGAGASRPAEGSTCVTQVARVRAGVRACAHVYGGAGGASESPCSARVPRGAIHAAHRTPHAAVGRCR